jgi:O-antigen ligase
VPRTAPLQLSRWLPNPRLAFLNSPARTDATALLSVYIVLLVLLPSRLIVRPLGAAGTPANIVAGLGIAWWVWSVAAEDERKPFVTHPPRRAALLFAGSVAVSYIAATIRPINGEEMSTANIGLLLVVCWVGVVVLADGYIPTMERFETVLRRLALAGGVMCTVGIAQFFTGRPLVDMIHIPGLSLNNGLVGAYARDGYTRPAGTAIHPIEFGVAMAMLLPICLHVAMHQRQLNWARRWLPVLAIGFAIPASISRSAIVGVGVVGLVLLPTWDRVTRRRMVLAAVVATAALSVMVPGMIGTLSKLFTRAGHDESALSRTDSYPLAWEFIQRSPVVGRGFQTFLPSYRILDNQYLGLIIDCGFLGLVTLLGFFACAFLVAFGARRRFTDPAARSACASLAASLAAGGVCLAFVDGFSFPLMGGLIFLVGGLIGTAHRLSQPEMSEMRHGSQIDNRTGRTVA